MKRICKYIIVPCFLACILAVAATSAAYTQREDLSIGLTVPNEGETFYAGPSSMLYNIPIRGWVESQSYSPTEILVEIAIYKDSTLTTSYRLFADTDGTYEIYATVNPGAYTDNFEASFLACGDKCHDHAVQILADDWSSVLDLPPGSVLIVATASDPVGRAVSVQRNIIVDHSDYAIVPVQVVLSDDSQFSIENIPVSASTWLYMWRSRFASDSTDENGVAHIRVEALAQASTTYRFEVKPTVVNGVVYESIAPVEIVLPPAAMTGPLVTLQLKTNLGTIQGNVIGDGEVLSAQLQVWAIHLPDGDARTSQVSPQGAFTFENIPIGEYVIAGDIESLGTLGFDMAQANIDLLQSNPASVDLNLMSIPSASIQGRVLDTDGASIPFAWIHIDRLNSVGAVMPDTGQYALFGLPPQKVSLVASAPGYYSDVLTVDLAADSSAQLDIVLTPRSEIRRITWGDGEIVVSPETRIGIRESNIFLERGWMWGHNQEDEDIVIQMDQVEIKLSSGNFAIEHVPGQSAWLYVFEGGGTVYSDDGLTSVPIQAGQMLIINERSPLSVIPFDPVVVATLHTNVQVPISVILQPTLMTRITGHLASLGIDFATTVSFITYSLVIIAILIAPFIGILRWRRKKQP